MAKKYYTYRIRVANRDLVQVEKRDDGNQDLEQPSGFFRYQDKLPEIAPLLEIAKNGELDDSGKARSLGETLFDILFDDVLRQDFVNFYYRVVQQEGQLLRVELDIDERLMPEIAALPWEFLCLPARANLGTIWMATVPNLVFSRRRAQPNVAKKIQLERDEKLKIALVVSAPPDLAPVAYEPVQKALDKLARERGNKIELLPIVSSANSEEIDYILSQNPHIVHFVGHGRLLDKGDRKVGQIAFVDPDLDEAMWVEANYFSELFNKHRPGVVVLQACESGMLSASEAFVGVASSIVEQNIPVVVAMQYEVSNSTASRFARRFYQQLAADDPVDIAAQYGRRTIALGPTQYRKRDFATPVIFMRVTDGYLFERQGEKVESKVVSLPPIKEGYHFIHYLLTLVSLAWCLIVWFFLGFWAKSEFPILFVFELIIACLKGSRHLYDILNHYQSQAKPPEEHFYHDKKEVKLLKELNKREKSLYLVKKIIKNIYKDMRNESISIIIDKLEHIKRDIHIHLEPLKRKHDPTLYKIERMLEIITEDKTSLDEDFKLTQKILIDLINKYKVTSQPPSHDLVSSLLDELDKKIKNTYYNMELSRPLTLKNVLELLKWVTNNSSYEDASNTASNNNLDREFWIKLVKDRIEKALTQTNAANTDSIEKIKEGITKEWIKRVSIYGFEKGTEKIARIELAFEIDWNNQKTNFWNSNDSQEKINLEETLENFNKFCRKAKLFVDCRVIYTDPINRNYYDEQLGFRPAPRVEWATEGELYKGLIQELEDREDIDRFPNVSTELNFGPRQETRNDDE